MNDLLELVPPERLDRVTRPCDQGLQFDVHDHVSDVFDETFVTLEVSFAHNYW